MKKNKMMRIASILLVAVLLSTCAISGTFAKYTSTVTGSDSVTVAKWAIEVNDTEIVKNGAPAFALFDTAAQYDEDGNDVAAGKIAPGTQGSFNFKVENVSEVSVKYAITFTVTFPTGIDNTRFKFYSNDTMTTEISADATGKYTVVSDVEIEVNDTEADVVNVYWQWTFADTVDDSDLGELAQNGTTTVTVAPTITVEQVD